MKTAAQDFRTPNGAMQPTFDFSLPALPLRSVKVKCSWSRLLAVSISTST